MPNFRPGISESSRRLASRHADVLQRKGGFFGRLLQAKPDRGNRGMEFNADDLRKIKVEGAPLMLDHNHMKKGEIGKILHQFFDEQSGWLCVWGQVHDEGRVDPKLRDDLLAGLRSSKLGSLSIKYTGNESLSTGNWIPESKRVEEVSLVDIPRFEGTHLLTVNAGANSQYEVQLFPAGSIEAMSAENPVEQSTLVAEAALGRKLSEEERAELALSPNPSSLVGSWLVQATAAKLNEKKAAAAAPPAGDAAKAAVPAGEETAAAAGEAEESPEALAQKNILAHLAAENQFYRDNYKKQQAADVAKVLEVLHKTKSPEEYARMEKIIQNVSANPAQETSDMWSMIKQQTLASTSQGDELKKLRQERNQYKAEVDTYKKASAEWIGRGRSKAAAGEARDPRDASPVRAAAGKAAAKSDVGAEVSVAASRRAFLDEQANNDFPHSSFNPQDPHYAENMHFVALLNGKPELYMRYIPHNPNERLHLLPAELGGTHY
jgi:hypothetical protein